MGWSIPSTIWNTIMGGTPYYERNATLPWEEILARLAEQDLLRFRVVSTEWNELISCDSFAKYHAQVGPKPDSWIMCFMEDRGSNPLVMYNPRTSRWVTPRLELTDSDIEIGGYGGLVCMDEGDPIAFNLFTRTWKRFPAGFKIDQLLFHDGQWVAVSLEERTIHTMQETGADSWTTRRASWNRLTLSSFAALSGRLFCVVTALKGVLNLEECSMSNWSWGSYLFARLVNGERTLFSVEEFVSASIAPPILLNVAGKLMLIALLWSTTNERTAKLVIYELKLVERVAECVEVSALPGALVEDIEKLEAVVAGQVIYIHTSWDHHSKTSILSFDTVSRKWGRMQLPDNNKYSGQNMQMLSYHGPVLRTKLSEGLPKYKQPSTLHTLVHCVLSFLLSVPRLITWKNK